VLSHALIYSCFRAQFKLKAFRLIYCHDFDICDIQLTPLKSTYLHFYLRWIDVFFCVQDNLFGDYDTQYSVLYGTLSHAFIDLVPPPPKKHKLYTPDWCHTAPRTQCHVGKPCRSHTGWAPAPSSPPRTAGDKHALLPLKTHAEKKDAHCTFYWTLLLTITAKIKSVSMREIKKENPSRSPLQTSANFFINCK